MPDGKFHGSRFVAKQGDRADFKKFLKEHWAEVDPDRVLITRPTTALQWHALIEHNLTRWRNGQEPEYEAWRERYLERGLTDMEFELLQWIIRAGVSFLNLPWDFNKWPDTRREDAWVLARALGANARGDDMNAKQEKALKKMAAWFGMTIHLPIKFEPKPRSTADLQTQ